MLSGAGPDRFWARSAQKREREREPFLFFCQVNNARLYRFPVSQISGNLYTRRESKRWWIPSENICENLPVRGLFPQRQLFSENLHETSDFRPRFLRNEYKRRKVMTGWHAYGLLAFHMYGWNQLKVILLAHGVAPCPKNTFLRRPYETTSRHAA